MVASKLPPLLTAAALGLLATNLTGCKGCSNKDKDGDDVSETGPTEPPPFTNDWGQWLAMGVTPDGAPAAVAYDLTQGAITYATAELGSDGTPTWTHEEVDGYADSEGLDQGDRGAYASMAIASDGTVWASYYDLKVKNLRYAKRDPADGTWTNGIADTGEGATKNAGLWSSIALDASGNPVIAHHDEEKGTLRVAHWGGSSFSGEVVDEGSDVTGDTGETIDADVGAYAKLRISGGTEYIAYYDAAAGALKLAVGSSGSYSVEVVDDSADVGAWPDLLIDDQGQVHIAYQDVENQDLKYAVGSPGSWTISTIDDGEYRGADAALFMNGSYPGVVYFDGRYNNAVLAQKAGDTWSSDTLAGDDAALGFHNEVITVGGSHYAGCFDHTNRTVWFGKL